jgi:uncharacterized membrane protein YeaQ/YmgE (transglycosylase-associated protein family)
MILLFVIIKQAQEFTSIINGINEHPVLVWIILGLIAGFIASKIVNSRGEGVIRDILLGIVGSVIGGWSFDFFELSKVFGVVRVTGLNLMSLLIAVVGGVIFLVVYHGIFRRSISRRARYF